MWMLQTILSPAFICMWILLQNVNGISTITTDSPRKEARYPNPRTHHNICHRRRPSFVCDPDNLLSWEEANRLDLLLQNIQNTTPCLCPACPIENPSGISIGVFLRENFTDEERFSKGFSSDKLAETLRKEWRLGKCNDDIIIVLIAEEKRAAVSLGNTILSVLPYQAAEGIARECEGHFKGNYTYFPQGLSAMIYSFHDILQQSPRRDTKSVRRKNVGIIIGISLGVIVIIILIASAIILVWRYFQKKKISKTSNNTVGWKKPQDSEPYEYKLCKMENSSTNNNAHGDSSDSDEENHYDSSGYDTDEDLQKQGTYRKRELSDVPEEAEDILPATDEDTTEVQTITMKLSPPRSLEVTEL